MPSRVVHRFYFVEKGKVRNFFAISSPIYKGPTIKLQNESGKKRKLNCCTICSEIKMELKLNSMVVALSAEKMNLIRNFSDPLSVNSFTLITSLSCGSFSCQFYRKI